MVGFFQCFPSPWCCDFSLRVQHFRVSVVYALCSSFEVRELGVTVCLIGNAGRSIRPLGMQGILQKKIGDEKKFPRNQCWDFSKDPEASRGDTLKGSSFREVDTKNPMVHCVNPFQGFTR
eukprot:s379_g14.t1